MQTMQLVIEDEFYPEIMAFLELLVEEKKIEILETYGESNEGRRSSLDTCSMDDNRA
ncbi:hypothetical protein [Sulfuricurvum sp.]|uniref:hypothetical protein n=1 Tax=Sulfuricurvum sp. TaxID=2025608 RepID=UPI00262AF43F|nr:hypothetical protein [Sulfuricurvum sp.]MDD2780430.1 hypothetical protein [Sulfuricurvum sp.]